MSGQEVKGQAQRRSTGSWDHVLSEAAGEGPKNVWNLVIVPLQEGSTGDTLRRITWFHLEPYLDV